jgi:RES domain
MTSGNRDSRRDVFVSGQVIFRDTDVVPCLDLPGEPDYAEIESVCLSCMGAPLRATARKALTHDSCSFCESTGIGIAMQFDEFIELIELGLSGIYDAGSEVGNPPSDGGDGREWFSYAEVASAHCWEAVGDGDDDVRYFLFKAIENALGEKDINWTYVDNGFTRLTLRYGWEEFKRSVTEPAFEAHWVLNPDAFIAELQQILTDIPGIVRVLPAGTAFWRARPYNGDVPPFLVNGKQLGSAPNQFAKANRMSAEGVSMFYGSDEMATAIEEVKYGTNDSAAVGQFVSATKLTVVDLTDIGYEPSIFDPNERDDYYAVDFLYGFARDISRPITDPDVQYRPTQLLTAKIRKIPWATIDGIRFHSVAHRGGMNYVLFCTNEECGDPQDSHVRLQFDSASAIARIPLLYGGLRREVDRRTALA